MKNSTKESLVALGAVVTGLAAAFGIAAALPEEDPKARKARLKREAADRKARQKAEAAQAKRQAANAKKYREAQRPTDDFDRISDIFDTLANGRRSNYSVVREIIACTDDATTARLYQAYENDGYEFSNVEKERVRSSMNSPHNYWYIFL